MRRLALLVLAGALTGCSGSSSGPPSPSPSASPLPSAVPTSAAPSLLPSPSASATAGPVPSSAAALPFCTTAHLRLSLGAQQGAAGTTYQPLVLTNTGAPCTLHGYPGVSFLDASGRQIGSPAEYSPGPSPRVLLRTGGSANALLGIAQAGNYPDSVCRPRGAERVRVYPPGERVPLAVADEVQVCSVPGTHQLHVKPVTPA